MKRAFLRFAFERNAVVLNPILGIEFCSYGQFKIYMAELIRRTVNKHNEDILICVIQVKARNTLKVGNRVQRCKIHLLEDKSKTRWSKIVTNLISLD